MGTSSMMLLLSLGAAAAGDIQTPGHVRVAAVQVMGCGKDGAAPSGLDPVGVLLPYIAQAGRDHTDLLVFPEYHLGHIAVPGPETARIAEAVQAARVHVIVGCWRQLDGPAYANTALLFGRDGAIAGMYDKTHAAVDKFDLDQTPWTAPPPGRDPRWFLKHDPEWTMERGAELPVFNLDFGRIGILTCYDGWFPEPWRVLSLKGAEIIVWINGRHGCVEDFIVKSAMFQNEVNVIATNQDYGAGTMIGHYPFTIVEKASEPGEACLSAVLDLAPLRNARAHSRNLAQRRPGLYGVLTEKMNRPRYLGQP